MLGSQNSTKQVGTQRRELSPFGIPHLFRNFFTATHHNDKKIVI
jgi:hypothetical protein